LQQRYGAEVELIKGFNGVFEITVDGRLAFSKKALGRFPEDSEIDSLGGG
jgi:selT/selW/selH-like putative selenoprotein